MSSAPFFFIAVKNLPVAVHRCPVNGIVCVRLNSSDGGSKSQQRLLDILNTSPFTIRCGRPPPSLRTQPHKKILPSPKLPPAFLSP